jgi:hypothetical protein
MNYYETFSTATLAKLLDRAAAGSAQHRAIQEELHQRDLAQVKDTQTILLFTGKEWESTKEQHVF